MPEAGATAASTFVPDRRKCLQCQMKAQKECRTWRKEHNTSEEQSIQSLGTALQCAEHDGPNSLPQPIPVACNALQFTFSPCFILRQLILIIISVKVRCLLRRCILQVWNSHARRHECG